jgi:hypothetical protein
MERCYLCDHPAYVAGRGIAYYRFYDIFKPGWVNEAICTTCLTKLNGPDRPQIRVKEET